VSVPPPTRPRPRGFLGWWVVAAAAVLQLLQSALVGNSFGVYVVALTSAFGWSKTVLSTGYALSQFESGVVGPLLGGLIDRVGARRVVAAGVVLLGVGLFMLGAVRSLPGFYAAMLVLGLGTGASGWVATTAAVVPWFVRQRARALAMTAAGASVGGLLVPLVAAAVDAFGWRETLMASGALVLVVGLPLTGLVRRDPARYGQHPDGQAAPGPSRHPRAPATPDPESTFTVREALRTRAFWLLGAGHGGALMVVSAVVVHLIAYLSEDRGFTLAAAASVMGLVTLTSLVGQVAGGVFGDRFEKRLVAALAMLAHAASLLVLAWGPGTASVLVFAVLHGLAWGVRGPLMGAIRADYFGAKHFGAILGLSMLLAMVGQLAGPIAAGTLADLLGDYRLGFTVLAGFAVLGWAAFTASRPPAPPPR
jgi:sugar phosphate permease